MKKYIFTFILFIVLIVSSYGFLHIKKNDKLFSTEKWDTEIWEREHMIKDLTENYNFYKMDFEQVLNLLGTNGVVEGSHITYYVGKTYSGPVLFSISFDDRNHVINYDIIID